MAQPARRRASEPSSKGRKRRKRRPSRAAHPILAARHGLNPKAVAKWRARRTTAEALKGRGGPAARC
jgi:hypothetical protein